MKELFGVLDYNKTYQKHENRINKLTIAYTDIIDTATWQAVHTQSWHKWQLMQSAYSDKSEKQQQQMKARLINEYTRNAIRGSLEFNGLPVSYDTAFYMKYYKKINKGMEEVLKTL